MPVNQEQSSPLNVPAQKNYEYAYKMAFNLVVEEVGRLPDIKEQCNKCGALYYEQSGQPSVIIEYLNNKYQIIFPELDVLRISEDKPVELRDKLLILHYFVRAKGTQLSKRLITYQELQEGSVYYPSFFKRAIKPLVDFFGDKPELLLEASKFLGGIKAEPGDLSVTIPAFPRVPVTIIIWKGDEEFPPGGNILFDSNILDFLTVEDVNILCQTITFSLINYCRSRR